MLLLGLAITFWLGFAKTGFCAENLPIPLLQASQQIQAEFNRMDLEISRTAIHLGKQGLAGDSARLALQDLCQKFDYAVDCSAVSDTGVLVTVEPALHSYLEGSSLVQQPHVLEIMTRRRPVMSPVYRTLEEISATDIEYPVFNADGQYLGAVSMLILPEKMLSDHVGAIIKGLPIRLWAMEPGGRILYDRDASQTGRNLFTSDLYRPFLQMINLGHAIASSTSGSDVCEFLRPRTNQPVRYRSSWQSVSLFGAEWRIVATYPQPQKTASKGNAPTPEKLRQNLAELARNFVLIEALKTDNTPMTLSLFRDFHAATPGLYAIQWINAAYMNRLGFPLENSLSNYSFNPARRSADGKFIQIVSEKIPAEFTTQLYEGVAGQFLLQPVFDNDHYLGMIYTITLP